MAQRHLRETAHLEAAAGRRWLSGGTWNAASIATGANAAISPAWPSRPRWCGGVSPSASPDNRLERFVTILRVESATGARSTLQRWRVPLGFAAAIAFLVFSRPTWRSLAIGAPLATLGLVVRAWASGVLRKNQELTTSGPYAYTRNPLYAGSFLMLIGCAVG